MKFVFNFPLWEKCLDEFGSMEALSQECADLGCDGLEVISDVGYAGPYPKPGLAIGYHLVFFSDWVDFWLGKMDIVKKKFGADDVIEQYYGGFDRKGMLDQYAKELATAEMLGSEYVVFHVSDVSLEESFSYKWLHSDEQVIDCAIECINMILKGKDWPFAFLVENQWWPGLKFTDPALTARLLDGIEFENKGVMLDIGHLMSTNQDLRSQAEAADYVNRMLDEHGELASAVRGIHLHYSLSGEYLQNRGFSVPDNVKEGGYWERYSNCYTHILTIDQHKPWTDPAIAPVLKRINPEWVNNELSAYGRGPHGEAVRTQMDTLRRGGLI